MIYLTEGGRVPQGALEMLEVALIDEASGMVVVPLDAAIAETLHKIPRSAVPDMPDRIIAATASYLHAPLVTRDRRLRSAGIETIW
jgi:PIN domain nuclease of toxin-antitoxin system